MISAENNKRNINGKFKVIREVFEEDVFRCKYCGSPVTWFKSTLGRIYPVDCMMTKGSWKARAFMGNHKNSTPPHYCRAREVKDEKSN